MTVLARKNLHEFFDTECQSFGLTRNKRIVPAAIAVGVGVGVTIPVVLMMLKFYSDTNELKNQNLHLYNRLKTLEKDFLLMNKTYEVSFISFISFI